MDVIHHFRLLLAISYRARGRGLHQPQERAFEGIDWVFFFSVQSMYEFYKLYLNYI